METSDFKTSWKARVFTAFTLLNRNILLIRIEEALQNNASGLNLSVPVTLSRLVLDPEISRIIDPIVLKTIKELFLFEEQVELCETVEKWEVLAPQLNILVEYQAINDRYSGQQILNRKDFH